METHFHSGMTLAEITDMDKYRLLFNSLSEEMESLNLINACLLRQSVATSLGFCMPQPSFFPDVAEFLLKGGGNKVIGINSGGGMVEMLLRYAGLDVVATDIRIPVPGSGPDVLVMDSVDATRTYAKDRTCICSIWPPLNSPVLYDALTEADRQGHSYKYVIYGGEEKGGCTECDAVHDYLSDRYTPVRTYEVFKWKGLADSIYLHALKD